VDSAALELVEQVVDSSSTPARRMASAAACVAPAFCPALEERQQVLRIDDARRTSSIVFLYTGMRLWPSLMKVVDDLVHRGGDGQGRHVRPWNHDLVDASARPAR